MNIAIVPNSSIKTMTSMEMAELTGKRHDSVKRTIDKLAENGVVSLPQIVEVSNQGFGPSTITEYLINERDSYVVVAQLSPEFTARLVDRWRELEAAAPPKIAAPKRASDPALAAIRTAKALQMNIESAAAIRAMFPSLGEQSHQVIFSKIVGGDVIPLPLLENRTYTATEVAAKLGTSANAIGRSANSLGLKTTQYGIFVLDKSKSSDKQVETFRYNDAGVSRLADLLGVAA